MREKYIGLLRRGTENPIIVIDPEKIPPAPRPWILLPMMNIVEV